MGMKLRLEKGSEVLRILLIGEAIYLLFNSISQMKDYQDTWVLQGLEVPYLLFVTTFVILFLCERDFEYLLLMAILARYTFVLIPNLKYDFFLGRSMDQHLQYVLSRDVILLEKISPLYNYPYYPTGRYYIESPFFHIAMSIFSQISGFDLEKTMKVFPILLNVIYPLYGYILLNKFMPNAPDHVKKIGLFLTAIPINSSISYLVTGSLFVYVFLLAILIQTLNLLTNANRKNYLMYIILVFGSTLSHPIETLHFLAISFIIIVIYSLIFNRGKTYLIQLYFTGLVLNLGWILNRSDQFDYITALFVIKESSGTVITPTFFRLFEINIINTLKIIMLTYGTSFFLSFLTLISIYVIVKHYGGLSQLEPAYKFLILYTLLVWGLTGIGFILGIGFDYFGRVYRLAYFTHPLLSSYFIVKIANNRIRNVIMMVILVTVVGFSTLQYYSPPFMIPNASIVYPEVGADEPLLYRGQVNSIYQLEMIRFSNDYVQGRIASDAVTRNQMIGLTPRDYFNDYVTWYYPLNKEIYPDIEEKEYEYFMLHIPGISGAYEERADIRSAETINAQITSPEYSLIYSNSKSLILYNNKR